LLAKLGSIATPRRPRSDVLSTVRGSFWKKSDANRLPLLSNTFMAPVCCVTNSFPSGENAMATGRDTFEVKRVCVNPGGKVTGTRRSSKASSTGGRLPFTLGDMRPPGTELK
jgi:hypothetical protein